MAAPASGGRAGVRVGPGVAIDISIVSNQQQQQSPAASAASRSGVRVRAFGRSGICAASAFGVGGMRSLATVTAITTPPPYYSYSSR